MNVIYNSEKNWIDDAKSLIVEFTFCNTAMTIFIKFLELSKDSSEKLLLLKFIKSVIKRDREKEINRDKLRSRMLENIMNGKYDNNNYSSCIFSRIFRSENPENVSVDEQWKQLMLRIDYMLTMIAIEILPLFMRSLELERAIEELITKDFKINSLISRIFQCNYAPANADEWMIILVDILEKNQLSFTVSDMTVPGVPLTYVGTAFCKLTGYSKSEAVGRNCRFLQGPETEHEAVEIIRGQLKKGLPCDVCITNYRKSKEKFMCHLTFLPIFDLDGLYRYTVGFNTEVVNGKVSVNDLLHLVPTRIALPSKAMAQALGKMAPKLSGEQNISLLKKTELLQDAKSSEQTKEWMQSAQRTFGDKLSSVPEESKSFELNLDQSIFAFTKIMWLNKPVESMQAIISDPIGREMFSMFTGITSMVYQYNFDFCCHYDDIANCQEQEKEKALIRLYNEYSMTSADWIQFKQEADKMNEISLTILSSHVLLYFMNSKLSQILIAKLREREVRGETHTLCTVAIGLDVTQESAWLDMFRIMSDSLKIGMVLTDMTVPGLPLVYINDGFRAVTGYGKEKIGSNCRFLQGPETELYLNDEIRSAIQQSKPSIVKLHNVKSDGQIFQCLLALHPVFGSCDEYKYQIGLQLNFSLHSNIITQLIEMNRVLHQLPKYVFHASYQNISYSEEYSGDPTVSPKAKITPALIAKSNSQDDLAMSSSSTLRRWSQSTCSSHKKSSISHSLSMDQSSSPITDKLYDSSCEFGRNFTRRLRLGVVKFQKSPWVSESSDNLQTILNNEIVCNYFHNFIVSQGFNAMSLQFFLVTRKLEDFDTDVQNFEANDLLHTFSEDVMSGLIKRSDALGSISSYIKSLTSINAAEIKSALWKVKGMAEVFLKILCAHFYPLFATSEAAKTMIKSMDLIRPADFESIQSIIASVSYRAPRDADEWINAFAFFTESFPLSISITDITIAGAPLIFVNQQFCLISGFNKEEVLGRNCRFLQGPDTEEASVALMQNSLRNGVDCHVKITNYRKNGQRFVHIVSLKTVYDIDGIFRFVIGFQFEISKESSLSLRFALMQKLFELLPSRLPLRSKPSATARGRLAASSAGYDRELVATADVLPAKALTAESVGYGGSRPKEIYASTNHHLSLGHCLATMTAFTRIMWLQNPVKACRGVLLDDECRKCFLVFAERKCSLLTCNHIKFIESMKILGNTTPLSKRYKLLRKMHKVYDNNILFYCTTNEIPVGQLDDTDWGAIYENMCVWQEQTIVMLATDAFQRFLEDPSSTDMIVKLQQREAAGEELPLQTAGYKVRPDQESCWLDMFRAMAETMSIGIVVTDVTIPGAPLAYINEGFRAVTGYGKEKIGTNCRFLQGPETQKKHIEQIVASIQQSEPLLVKLHNYKADGQKFQCLLALHPVFGPAPEHEYKYMIGMQLDFNDQDPDLQSKIAEMARVLRYLPQTVTGRNVMAVDEKIWELNNTFNDIISDENMSRSSSISGEEEADEEDMNYNKEMAEMNDQGYFVGPIAISSSSNHGIGSSSNHVIGSSSNHVIGSSSNHGLGSSSNAPRTNPSFIRPRKYSTGNGLQGIAFSPSSVTAANLSALSLLSSANICVKQSIPSSHSVSSISTPSIKSTATTTTSLTTTTTSTATMPNVIHSNDPAITSSSSRSTNTYNSNNKGSWSSTPSTVSMSPGGDASTRTVLQVPDSEPEPATNGLSSHYISMSSNNLTSNSFSDRSTNIPILTSNNSNRHRAQSDSGATRLAIPSPSSSLSNRRSVPLTSISTSDSNEILNKSDEQQFPQLPGVLQALPSTTIETSPQTPNSKLETFVRFLENNIDTSTPSLAPLLQLSSSSPDSTSPTPPTANTPSPPTSTRRSQPLTPRPTSQHRRIMTSV